MIRKLILIVVFAPCALLADFVEVQRNANVYTEPRSSSAVLRHIRVDEESDIIRLPVADPALANGYHNVIFNAAGDTGWVYKSRVRRFPGHITIESDGHDHAFAGLPDHSGLDDAVSIVENIGYVAGFSEAKWTPLWVSYFLGPEQPLNCERTPRFLVDDRTEAQIRHNDYSNSGYDRGHMAPSHNIGSRYGCPAQRQTYLMSNISPQIPLLNQRPWGAFERVVSSTYAQSFDGVWVITGPIFDDDTVTMLCSEVEIPVAFYKIVVREVQGSPDILAIVADQDTEPGTAIRDLLETVDEIEQRTGIDFFSALPDSIENAVEADRATEDIWLLEEELDTNFRPTQRPFCTQGPIPREDLVF